MRSAKTSSRGENDSVFHRSSSGWRLQHTVPCWRHLHYCTPQRLRRTALRRACCTVLYCTRCDCCSFPRQRRFGGAQNWAGRGLGVEMTRAVSRTAIRKRQGQSPRRGLILRLNCNEEEVQRRGTGAKDETAAPRQRRQRSGAGPGKHYSAYVRFHSPRVVPASARNEN